ncbi:capsule biosynthesis protein [Rubellimicrobium aerolatum]|uniref:Capsule biosynthesis protein n=1 Tax=Rubellimicrobium aerolatum TaxID=490979 RepID=A0ABW0SGG2_9RHOB|nr:capsule biosynthesis protein [Rubellimicrobium aerolatum]MBP1806632.1 capsular polysaccharide transport system permease protein [Rubellimicrobium aerolatum]
MTLQGPADTPLAPAAAATATPDAPRPEKRREISDAVLSAEMLEARRARRAAKKRAEAEATGRALPGEGRVSIPIRARARPRHWIAAASFALAVVAPTAISGWYLWERATPRYASEVGFSVRTEEAPNPLELLGGLTALSGAGASTTRDVDILYRFIQSREIVEAIDARLDLRTLWAKGDPDRDPVFAYHPPGTIEDLHDYWNRMVAVYLDTTTGLLDVQVQAFTPEDAQVISQAIYEESQTLINRLSDIAVNDTTRLARQQLDEAVEALKVARAAITRFRSENQVVDPVADITGQMTILNELQSQLAQQYIELDLLRENAPDSDPRVQQAVARVEVIQARIDEERTKFGIGRAAATPTAAPTTAPAPAATATAPLPDTLAGLGEGLGDGLGDGLGNPAAPLRPLARDDAPPPASDPAPEPAPGSDYADLVAVYEGLFVDQEFAQRSYLASLANYESSLNQGRQQTRYLAPHVEPTLAERSDFPERWSSTLLIGLFAFLSWMVLTLAGYALRDRR